MGDKYVQEEMQRRGLVLGGEQSGHIIFADHLMTGDGIGTALQVLRIMAATGKDLAELAGALVSYPQILVNVRVRERADYLKVPDIADAIARIEQRVDGQGRVLIRYSGTEPLLAHHDRRAAPGRDRRLGRRDRGRRPVEPGLSPYRTTRHRTRAPGTQHPAPSTRTEHSAPSTMHPFPRLSVNVNKVATLRNSRGGHIPSVIEAVRVCIDAGAPGITVHPARRRAAYPAPDVFDIAEELAPLRGRVEFNIEGDPRPDLVELVLCVKPDQCTLVPSGAG